MYQTGDGLPVVWTSSDGGTTWQFAWAAGGLVGSSSNRQIAGVADGTLLLFSGGTTGTDLWRTTDRTTWTKVALPPGMAQNIVTKFAAWEDGVTRVVVENKGNPGPTKVTWRTLDGGLTWTPYLG